MMNGGDITLIILCENSATLRLCGELISKNNQFTKSFNFFSPQRTGGAEMTAELMGYHFQESLLTATDFHPYLLPAFFDHGNHDVHGVFHGTGIAPGYFGLIIGNRFCTHICSSNTRKRPDKTDFCFNRCSFHDLCYYLCAFACFLFPFHAYVNPTVPSVPVKSFFHIRIGHYPFIEVVLVFELF